MCQLSVGGVDQSVGLERRDVGELHAHLVAQLRVDAAGPCDDAFLVELARHNAVGHSSDSEQPKRILLGLVLSWTGTMIF